ncbi:hypothetical protein ACIP25_30875 [Streptomyces massasporeus]|uniref:hypothetical protein n=2 Tax=Streptomyces massasporeus TaxID=67324 RepID=UPI00382EC827
MLTVPEVEKATLTLPEDSGTNQCPGAPEGAAYVRMLLHCSGCWDCRIVDDDGEAVGDCVTGGRLHEEYRQARRGPVLGNGLWGT